MDFLRCGQWRCEEFPAFHALSSGLPVGHRVNTATEVARTARAHWRLGGRGLLVAAPVPAAFGLDLEELLVTSAEAERRVAAEGITGPAVTPAVLAHLVELTDGRVLSANLRLAEHNAAVAADIAVALAAS